MVKHKTNKNGDCVKCGMLAVEGDGQECPAKTSKPSNKELIRVCNRLSAALADEVASHYKPTGEIPDQRWNVEILMEAQKLLDEEFKAIFTDTTKEAINYYGGHNE